MINILKNIIRIILGILLIGTFFIIFGFSNQSGEESSGISRKVTEFIAEKILNIPDNAKQEIIENMEGIVRKIAHFSIYTLVGILIMAFMSTYKLLLWKKLGISIMGGLIYAISDEYHQSFIPGRSAEVRDVLIDLSGVIFGIIIVLVIILLYKALGEK